jgi:putative endopeptidase
MKKGFLKSVVSTSRLAALFVFFQETDTIAQNAGINFSYMDTTVNPRDDFYNYCNGSWQKTFVLPESDARYGSFNEINEANLKKIKLILDAASKNKTAAPNTDTQRLRDFYNTAMDSLKAESLGYLPIKEQLDMVDSVSNIEELMILKAEFEKIGIDLFFSSGVSPDFKNSRKNCFGISQGGLGLGDRDYYFSDKYQDIRREYSRYVSNLFLNIGTPQKDAHAYGEIMMEFEVKLANAAFTRVEMRDLQRLYNIYNKKALDELTPNIKWENYFKQRNVKQPDTAIVGMVEYMKNLSWLLERAPLANLKTYAKARLLMEAAPYLNRKFLDTHFRFRGVIMSGTRQLKPLWQRTQNIMNTTMGDIVSQEFVKKYFTVEAKLKLNKLIDNLTAAYRERIASRDWMSAETKKQANRKLDLLIRKIGYPTKWKNYTGLVIGTDNFWANVCRANKWMIQDNLNELKKPVDRNKWQMTPVTVNAYYDPTTNEITFPAAILQPPFYDPKADDAANYGTMGSIIGHELTHGFDDQGSQFDAQGNMKMWWSSEDYERFKAKTKKIIEQFDAYIALDTLHVNGAMTQGENIADLGGLTMSYYAYKKSLMGAKSKNIRGLSGEQRFFIAWAQGWKAKTRDAELKRLLTVDYHSPAYFRAWTPLTNMKEFYEAFNVTPGDKMFVQEEKRVEIW